MNCKQGDLAIVVHSEAGNLGKIVRCIRLATKQEMSDAGFLLFLQKPSWIVDVDMKVVRVIDETPSGFRKIAFDSQLRPIRDNDQEDETLTWLHVRSKEKA